jgi:gluconolactonase
VACGGADRKTLFCTDSTHGQVLRATLDIAGLALTHGLEEISA